MIDDGLDDDKSLDCVEHHSYAANNIDDSSLPISSYEEGQDTDRLLKGLELNINLVENSSKVIETIEEQSPILERELMTTANHIKNLTSRLSMHETVTKVAENVINSIREEYNIPLFQETKIIVDEDDLETSSHKGSLLDHEEEEEEEEANEELLNAGNQTFSKSTRDLVEKYGSYWIEI